MIPVQPRYSKVQLAPKQRAQWCAILPYMACAEWRGLELYAATDADYRSQRASESTVRVRCRYGRHHTASEAPGMTRTSFDEYVKSKHGRLGRYLLGEGNGCQVIRISRVQSCEPRYRRHTCHHLDRRRPQSMVLRPLPHPAQLARGGSVRVPGFRLCDLRGYLAQLGLDPVEATHFGALTPLRFYPTQTL